MAQTEDWSDERATKRPRVGTMKHHKLEHVQQLPTSIEPAPQDHRATEQQLYQGLTTALTLAGFDSVTASALESLKIIVNFLETVCMSMIASRRTTPIPQDFILALAELGLSPSQLESHLSLKIPDTLSCPALAPPAPDEPPPKNLTSILGEDLCEPPQRILPQIPVHFPALPSKHTWRNTPFETAREKDPRKIRERATQEGIQAEQSLRKLQSALHAPRSKADRVISAKELEKEQIWQEAMASVAGAAPEDSQMNGDGDVSMTDGVNGRKGAAKEAIGLRGGTAMVVNYDRAHWRKGASLGSVRS